MSADPSTRQSPVTVTPARVRAAVVAAQRIPAPGVGGEYQDAADVLRSIGLIQLDPLTRVSTAQRLTSLTRLPRNHRAADVDLSLWPADGVGAGGPVAFEAFTKVACVFPIEDWPLLELRRQRVRQTDGQRIAASLRESIREVVGSSPRGVQIGTIESALGSERTTGWNWSQIKQTAELMVRMGELVITARDGVVRLFDLPERALPETVRQAQQLPVEELRAGLARRAASNLAVMTVADFAHHYHLRRDDAAHGIELAGLVPVRVETWRETGFVLPELLDDQVGKNRQDGEHVPGDDASGGSGSGPPAGMGRVRDTRLVGPFDPLLRDRRRALRIFGFDYTFEAYVPRAKRVYGHYVMGVLSGDRIIGRVDLQRSDGALQINRVFGEDGVPRRSLHARARAAAATLGRQLGAEPVWME